MNIGSLFLFNFSASFSSGGYKRLHAYAKWFNNNGGAWFAIHPRCADLTTEFVNNRFFIVKQPRFKRLYNDDGYLKAIQADIGQLGLYYSYGIPLYSRVARINWFHLSNVLPLTATGVSLHLSDRLKFGILGWKITRGLKYADVISAESNNSLQLLDGYVPEKLFLSVNGSDDELRFQQDKINESKENLVTVVGTHKYKALDDSLRVFEMLKKENSGLRLIIIGNEQWVPKLFRGRNDVVIRGMIERSEVMECLRRTKYYVSTTRIENSYNAASEGILLASESYISDIGPHRELLANVHFDAIAVPGVNRPLLHVKRDDLSGVNLKDWDTVVVNMIARYREASRSL
jgi:glycosyltransferase involved in cell wall biosynthesis